MRRSKRGAPPEFDRNALERELKRAKDARVAQARLRSAPVVAAQQDPLAAALPQNHQPEAGPEQGGPEPEGPEPGEPEPGAAPGPAPGPVPAPAPAPAPENNEAPPVTAPAGNDRLPQGPNGPGNDQTDAEPTQERVEDGLNGSAQAPESTEESRLDEAVASFSSRAISHPAFREYVRGWMRYPSGPLSERIATIILGMVSEEGVGDVWIGALPIHIFLLHWGEQPHPWVIDEAPEVVWLQSACELYREGASETEMEEFLAKYEQFKLLSVLGTYPLEDPVTWDVGPPGQRVVNIERQIWNFATAGADFYASDLAVADVIRTQLVGYQERGAVGISSPTRVVWEILWAQARRDFDAQNPVATSRTRFDRLFQEAYRAAYLNHRYTFPPTTTAAMTAADICDGIDNTRKNTLASVIVEWQQGNIMAHAETDESFENRRRIFVDATSEPNFLGWGYGPYDEEVWDANIEKAYNVFEERLSVELPPDDNLWDTAVRRLKDLKERHSIKLLLPHWPQTLSPNNYVLLLVKLALFQKAIEILEPEWQAAFITAEANAAVMSELEPSAAQLRLNHAGVMTRARNLTSYPYGPVQDRVATTWQAFSAQLPQDLSGPLRGRFEDMRTEANRVAWRYGGEAILPLARNPNESNVRLCLRNAKHVQSALQTQCYAAWEAAISREPAGDKRQLMERRFADMKRYHDLQGGYYRPCDSVPGPVVPQNLARLLGSGAGRGGPDGAWQFHSTAGSGAYGHAGIWVEVNDANQITARTVIKETYLARSWDQQWPWHDHRWWRIPFEYYIVASLKRLRDSENITTYTNYGIYENRRMYRIYMELCAHGDLHNLKWNYIDIAQRGGTDENGNLADAQIPAKMLFSIFEGLVTALYLMQAGDLPGLDSGQPALEPILHRDIKPANIFLAAPNPNYWRGIPTVKMGDYGLSVPISSPDFNSTSVGTVGYRAPESITYPPWHPQADHGHAISVACDIWVVGRVMLSLMSLDTGNPPDQEFGTEPDLSTPSPGIEGTYSEELCRLVRLCLIPDPTQRITIQDLWASVHKAVASYVGISEGPMKDLDSRDDVNLRYRPDIYWAFAAPAGG